MYILGFNCYMDDAAACLLKDGRIVAAAEEERFSRKKHDGSFPVQAIHSCLNRAGIHVSDLDHVAFNMLPLRDFHRRLLSIGRGFPRSLVFASSHGGRWFSMLRADRIFRRLIGPGRYRFHFVEHHLAHAASVFFTSPFEEAAILTMDGSGESTATLLARGSGTCIEKLENVHFPQSLGYLYTAFTQYLGFRANSGEGKVMGLASYGHPEFLEAFRKISSTVPGGTYRLDLSFFAHQKGSRVFYSRKVSDLFDHAPRVPESEITPFHENLAASLQERVQELCFHSMHRLHKMTGLNRLCIAGGVGLNCSMNGLIRHHTDFEEVYIQPSVSDTGGGLGAALYVYHQTLGGKRKNVMTHALYGPSYTDAEIRAAMPGGYAVEEVDPAERAAELLAAGKYIGWFQGCSEIGPRALGARSILADPRVPDMVDRLNAKVKFREPFRPYAPSALEEHAAEFFEDYVPSPFMLFTFKTRHEKSSMIPAIVHIDGTARVQGVTREANPLYHRMISLFAEKTDIPMVLNTSFNLRGEPLVEKPADAFKTFEHSGLRDLIAGNLHIRKVKS